MAEARTVMLKDDGGGLLQLLRRRDLIALLGSAGAAWPLSTFAQQPGEMHRIGVLMGGVENDSNKTSLAAFQQALRALKWMEGQNVRFDILWGNGDAVRIKALAAELVGLAPDVILGTNTPTVRSLKQATETIPIVFAGLTDPVGDGAVASLSKPGGNITGFTSFEAKIAGKWLQLLKEISPGVQRVAAIYNPDTAPYAIFLPVMEAVAPKLSVTLTRSPVRDNAAIASAISTLASAPGGGLVVLPDIFATLHQDTIFELSTRGQIPTMCPLEHFAAAGGLMSYGSDINDLFRQAALYVDRILRGEKPHDLPVQEPTKFELVINLKTAKAIGLTVPTALLVRADKVIE
jgi:putative ABC transport system substrate-binding protein